MVINVVQLKYQRFGVEQTNFQILHTENCCDDFKDLLTAGQIIPVKYETTIGYSNNEKNVQKKTSLKLALNFDGEKQDGNNVFIINSCPFCKEDIIIKIKETKDVSGEVYELQQKVKYLLNKEKVAPTKEQKEIAEEITKINNELSKYYYISNIEEGTV